MVAENYTTRGPLIRKAKAIFLSQTVPSRWVDRRGNNDSKFRARVEKAWESSGASRDAEYTRTTKGRFRIWADAVTRAWRDRDLAYLIVRPVYDAVRGGQTEGYAGYSSNLAQRGPCSHTWSSHQVAATRDGRGIYDWAKRRLTDQEAETLAWLMYVSIYKRIPTVQDRIAVRRVAAVIQADSACRNGGRCMECTGQWESLVNAFAQVGDDLGDLFADELWGAIKGEVLAYVKNPYALAGAIAAVSAAVATGGASLALTTLVTQASSALTASALSHAVSRLAEEGYDYATEEVGRRVGDQIAKAIDPAALEQAVVDALKVPAAKAKVLTDLMTDLKKRATSVPRFTSQALADAYATQLTNATLSAAKALQGSAKAAAIFRADVAKAAKAVTDKAVLAAQAVVPALVTTIVDTALEEALPPAGAIPPKTEPTKSSLPWGALLVAGAVAGALIYVARRK